MSCWLNKISPQRENATKRTNATCENVCHTRVHTLKIFVWPKRLKSNNKQQIWTEKKKTNKLNGRICYVVGPAACSSTPSSVPLCLFALNRSNGSAAIRWKTIESMPIIIDIYVYTHSFIAALVGFNFCRLSTKTHHTHTMFETFDMHGNKLACN